MQEKNLWNNEDERIMQVRIGKTQMKYERHLPCYYTYTQENAQTRKTTTLFGYEMSSI